MRWHLYLLVFWMAGLFSANGQGTANFNNLVTGTLRAPIYGPDAGDPTLAKTGQTPEGQPAGSQSYGGPLLAGSGFMAELWAGELGGSESSFFFVDRTSFRTGSAAGFIIGKHTVVPGIEPGERASFQVRVWDNRGGTIVTWEQALYDRQAGFGALGVSEIFSPPLPLGGTDDFGNSYPVVNLIGLESFNIAAVPEPSMVTFAVGLALVVLGGRRVCRSRING